MRRIWEALKRRLVREALRGLIRVLLPPRWRWLGVLV